MFEGGYLDKSFTSLIYKSEFNEEPEHNDEILSRCIVVEFFKIPIMNFPVENVSRNCCYIKFGNKAPKYCKIMEQRISDCMERRAKIWTLALSEEDFDPLPPDIIYPPSDEEMFEEETDLRQAKKLSVRRLLDD